MSKACPWWLQALVLLAAFATAPAHAAPVRGNVAPDADEIRAWADALFGTALAQQRFSGAQVVVVAGGDLVLAKGYGHADPIAGTAMDPERTRVRIGSATKTFTATAVAQLVADGRIASLDDPANRYLKRTRLPAWQGREITLRDLLTHRAGFEDTAYGLGTDRGIAHPVDATVIDRAMPAQVRAPGGKVVYSNFGTAVLGLVIEDVTGQDIASVFETRIFKPLGMHDSLLDMRLAADDALARPWARFPNGEAQPIDFIAMHPFIAPAGGITTTGRDMARYLQAQIDGANGTPSILPAEGFRALHARVAGNHDAVSGIGMVFLTSDWNGRQVIEHGGGWPGFQTVMFFVPELGIGVFANIVGEAPVANLGEHLLSLVGTTRLTPGEGGAAVPVLSSSYVRESALELVLGPYRPRQHDEALLPLETFVGSYRRERRAWTTSEALLDVVNAGYSVIQVSVGDSNRLTIRGVPGYRQVAPGVFWNADAAPQALGDPNTTALYAFDVQAGRAVALAPQLSVDSWTRTSELWNPRTQVNGLMLALLVLFSGTWALLWNAQDSGSRWSRPLPVLLLLTTLALPFILLGGYREGDGLMYQLLRGYPGRFAGLAIAGNIAFALALAIIASAIASWRRHWWGSGAWGVAHRMHYSLSALAALVVIAFLYSQNLIGWQLP